jgi:hypothetical protein
MSESDKIHRGIYHNVISGLSEILEIPTSEARHALRMIQALHKEDPNWVYGQQIKASMGVRTKEKNVAGVKTGKTQTAHKPFNFDAARRGDPIMTEHGAVCTLLMYVADAIDQECSVIQCGKRVITVGKDGVPASGNQFPKIVMAPKKRIVWINLYNNGLDYISHVHSTLEEANDTVHRNRIGNRAWPLEIEE